MPQPTFLEKFRQALRRSQLSPLSVRAYDHDVALFAAWLQTTGGDFGSLSSEEVLRYKNHLSKVERLGNATVNQRLFALRWLCRWACKQGLLVSDPAAEVKPLPVRKRQQPAGLEDEEVYALLREAGKSRPAFRARNYALVQLMTNTGLRLSEIVNLKVGDVTVNERSGSVRVHLGKGGKEREVPLNASSRRALRTYMTTREERRPEEPLFVSQERKVMAQRSIQSLVTELARRAKIERVPVSPHRLRHSFAIGYLRENPGKLLELQALLGHESLDSTAIYTRPSAAALAAGVEKLGTNVQR